MAALGKYKNGRLLKDELGLKLMKIICQEAAQVNYGLFPYVNKQEQFYSSQELEKIAIEVCKLTELNRCSMLQDLEANKKTEIGYLNGYIVQKARLMGILTPVNKLIEAMILEEENK